MGWEDGLGILDGWNIGMLEEWNNGAMDGWNIGRLPAWWKTSRIPCGDDF
jgi:hypothetical protein